MRAAWLTRFVFAPLALVGLTGAGSPGVEATWMVLANSTEARTFQLKEGTAENFARIVPERLLKMNSVAKDEKGKDLVVSDALMVGATRNEFVACELFRHIGNKSFTCLRDDDHDGQFESYSRTRLSSDIYLNGGWFYKEGKLAQPVSATLLNSRRDSPDIFVELFFENRAEWVGHNILQICIQRFGVKTLWGGKQTVRMCRPEEIDLKDADYPKGFNLYGGRVTFLSRDKDLIETRIEPPSVDVPL